MKQSCASCKHALFKRNEHYGECTLHWCLDGSAHPIISKDWTCGSDCKDYYCYEKLSEILAAHAAEVERLTGERDSLKEMDRTQCPNCTNCIKDLRDDKAKLLAERDAAVRERDAAVEALREIDTMREMFPDDVLIVGLCDKARAALAKIEGERNGQNV